MHVGRSVVLRVARWLAVSLSLLPGGISHAADLYVDGSRAVVSVSGRVSRGGTGTPGDPLWSLGQAAEMAESGDTIHVAGICRQHVVVQGRTDVTIRQWAGHEQAQIRGDVPVPADAWSPDSGDAYVAILARGVELSGVVFNWDTTIALEGIAHAGHLLPVASILECRLAPNSWYFNPLDARLYINLGGDDPRAGGLVGWCRRGTGLAFFECTRPVVEAIHVKLWPDPSPGAYGILFGTTTGARARDCKAWDCGYHSIGAAGQFCIDARIERCEFRGQRNGTHTVLFGAFGAVSGRVTDCVFHLYSLLGRDGTALLPDQGSSAFYTHTEGFNGVITDVECRGCVAYGYPGHGTSAGAFWYGTRTASVAAADEDDWRKYPVRFVDCRVIGSDRLYLMDSWGLNVKNGAFVRCRLDFSGSFDADPVFLLSAGAEHRLLFDHSVLFADTTGRTIGELIHVADGSRVIALNSTFYNAATDAAGYTDRGIARLDYSGVLKARQSVFVMASPGPFIVQVGQNGRPASDYDLKHCWYDGFADQWFVRDHETVRTKEAYRTGVDGPGVGTAALYDIHPGFVQPAAPAWSFEGAPGSPLRLLKIWFPALFIRYGVNARPYDGHWGAYQYGMIPLVPGP